MRRARLQLVRPPTSAARPVAIRRLIVRNASGHTIRKAGPISGTTANFIHAPDRGRRVVMTCKPGDLPVTR
jgi:hypothetical protein